MAKALPSLAETCVCQPLKKESVLIPSEGVLSAARSRAEVSDKIAESK